MNPALKKVLYQKYGTDTAIVEAAQYDPNSFTTVWTVTITVANETKIVMARATLVGRGTCWQLFECVHQVLDPK